MVSPHINLKRSNLKFLPFSSAGWKAEELSHPPRSHFPQQMLCHAMLLSLAVIAGGTTVSVQGLNEDNTVPFLQSHRYSKDKLPRSVFAAEQASVNPLYLEASLSVLKSYLAKARMWKTLCYLLQWRSISIGYPGAVLSFLTLWLLGGFAVLFSGIECQLYANNPGWQFTRSKFSPHFCYILPVI